MTIPDDGDGSGLLVLLMVDGALLGGIGLAFTPLYSGALLSSGSLLSSGALPVPMGAVLSILVLPWLVRRAGELDRRPALAGAPLWAWLVVVAVLGFAGPGGDVLLPPTWQSLLLVAGGAGAGLWSLRTVLNSEHEHEKEHHG